MKRTLPSAVSNEVGSELFTWLFRLEAFQQASSGTPYDCHRLKAKYQDVLTSSFTYLHAFLLFFYPQSAVQPNEKGQSQGYNYCGYSTVKIKSMHFGLAGLWAHVCPERV